MRVRVSPLAPLCNSSFTDRLTVNEFWLELVGGRLSFGANQLPDALFHPYYLSSSYLPHMLSHSFNPD
ncbi:MAG: hypothetical protein OQK04_11700 [Kangiellaceae bacterium]|nr:hypothetical protein [Kangiellaceae bacterium]MCW8999368.1 hypothetical protein [Kangiellaceae bacterium]